MKLKVFLKTKNGNPPPDFRMKKFILPALVIAVFAGSRLAGHLLAPHAPPPANEIPPGEGGRPPHARIVSLSPSITETLFALGLGEKVVGISNYCSYPPEAQNLDRIGCRYYPNYERIVALRPDLVVMQEIHDEARQALSWLVPDIMVVSHASLDGVVDSITAIGTRCDAREKAYEIVRDIQQRLSNVRHRTATLPRPRVLVSIGSDSGSGTLSDIYIAGRDGFFDKMLELAGGTNAYSGPLAYPLISAEGIISLNPDVIIEMATSLELQGLTVEQVRSKWYVLPLVNAMRNDRIYVLTDDYVNIPGPRFVRTVEDIAAVLHPE